MVVGFGFRKNTQSKESPFITVTPLWSRCWFKVWIFIDVLGMSAFYCLAWLGNQSPYLLPLRRSDSEIMRLRELLQGPGSLLWYPLTYTVLVLPLSIVRMANIASKKYFGSTMSFVAASIYTSGGFVNVLLYTSVFNGIISWKWGAWRQGPARRLSRYLQDRSDCQW